ncbi:MAG: hypothetical protein LUG95_04155 [Clostridiales bacterium]|nr:hypothetical protein [Clostridiales bacterium]
MTLFRATNVTIKNVTMTNVKNGHHLAIAGCSKVPITNCTFSKHYKSSSNTDSLEAVHLDILQKERFPGLASKSYDGTMNKNITVENCKFKNVDRGAGTHSIFTGKYMSNIAIKNNKFTNIKGYTIQGSGYINSIITGNKIKNCGAGIYFRSVIAGTDTTYKYGNKITHDTGTVIANNTISVRDNKSNDYGQTPYGIRIYGKKTTSSTNVSG